MPVHRSALGGNGIKHLPSPSKRTADHEGKRVVVERLNKDDFAAEFLQGRGRQYAKRRKMQGSDSEGERVQHHPAEPVPHAAAPRTLRRARFARRDRPSNPMIRARRSPRQETPQGGPDTAPEPAGVVAVSWNAHGKISLAGSPYHDRRQHTRGEHGRGRRADGWGHPARRGDGGHHAQGCARNQEDRLRGTRHARRAREATPGDRDPAGTTRTRRDQFAARLPWRPPLGPAVHRPSPSWPGFGLQRPGRTSHPGHRSFWHDRTRSRRVRQHKGRPRRKNPPTTLSHSYRNSPEHGYPKLTLPSGDRVAKRRRRVLRMNGCKRYARPRREHGR